MFSCVITCWFWVWTGVVFFLWFACSLIFVIECVWGGWIVDLFNLFCPLFVDVFCLLLVLVTLVWWCLLFVLVWFGCMCYDVCGLVRYCVKLVIVFVILFCLVLDWFCWIVWFVMFRCCFLGWLFIMFRLVNLGFGFGLGCTWISPLFSLRGRALF